MLHTSYVGDVDGLKTALMEGGDANYSAENGVTPLMLAQSPKCIKVLLEAGAEVNAVSRQGYTPLTQAMRFFESAMLLIQHGADMINVFCPLVALSELNGPTEFRPGSHLWPTSTSDDDGTPTCAPVAPLLLQGEILLFDYRCYHRGRTFHLDFGRHPGVFELLGSQACPRRDLGTCEARLRILSACVACGFSGS